MRYNPDTENKALSLEQISAACWRAVDAIPVERRDVLARVWDQSVGGYVNRVINLPVGCPYVAAV